MPMRSLVVGLVLMILVSTACMAGDDSAPTVAELLSTDLDQGEALVWYLGHSGWAVKTRSVVMIFDYWEWQREQRSLANGTIDPAELAGQKVIVFISHQHPDHLDPVVLEWQRTLPEITYVFGWEVDGDPDWVRFSDQREERDIAGVRVFNIHHEFDDIPESAFLVQVDGLTLYHAGDHGNGSGPLKPEFKGNIGYLAKQAKRCDMVFHPLFGGEIYATRKLRARVLFPMHEGGREHQYAKFAKTAGPELGKTQIAVAEQPGDLFFYADGTLTRRE